MISDAKVTRFAKLISWVVPGASFAGAIIAIIINSEFVPRRAIWGSVILAGLWIATYLLFKFLRIRSDENSRIVSPGKQIHLFFIGAIAALWIPLLLEPFKTQKVEIILDISQRMGEEFDPPGTTKFDAARAGVLQVLGYLEGQNMEVALRLVNSTAVGQCAIERETSLAVDFTRDFDKIRNRLVTMQPSPSDKAPVVNAIDFSIDHYLTERLFDQKFYIYSFIGGDDTCGEKMGVFLNSPKVIDNAVNSELFLVILLGTNEDIVLRNLPNTNLAYASNAAQVQQIVHSNNQLIATPTPTPTVAFTSTDSGGRLDSTETTFVTTEQTQIQNPIQPTKPVIIPSATPNIEPSATNIPLPTPTATPLPTPTRIPTQIPSSTPAPTDTPTDAPTDAPTDIPTNTPTLPTFVWIPLASQTEVFSPGCPLINHARVFAQFYQGQAGISAALVSNGNTNQGLRLIFSNVSNAAEYYAGWEVWLGADDLSGINLSQYGSLVFYIRGQAGGEEPNVYLMNPVVGGNYRRYWRDVEQVTPITTSWQQVVIPLSYFTSSPAPSQQVDLSNVQRIQILFEWYTSPTPPSGRIFIDDLCVQ